MKVDRIIRSDELRPAFPLPDTNEREVVPDRWNGPHVGLRVMEAFRTLSCIPASKGPKMFGEAWPAYSYEWGDLMAQQEQDADEQRHHQKAQNQSKEMPSVEAVTRMERCLYWPAHYLWFECDLLFAVNRLASAYALDRDAEWVVRKFGGFADTWRAEHDKGCGRIAEGLILDRVAVF